MPHLGVGDRVKETTTTTGTGTLNLDGAVAGFQTFVDGVGNGHETYYVITDPSTGDFEVGVGTITDAATDTLSRDSVITSSNAGSLVNFGVGTKDVFCSLPSERAVIIDDASNVEVTANVTATAFDGSGAALTALNASNVSSGTLDNARLDAQLQDIAGLATTSGKIIQGDGANFVLSSYTIPTSDGTTGQVLTTNGSGAVTFQTPTVGDITAVTAGSGLTGGGITGDVTLNVGAGTGVTVNADDIAIGQDVATSASPTFAGGTFTANVALGDLDRILMGTTGEYQIYHDHANGVSVIKDVDAGGSINIDADTISLTGGNVGIGTSSPSHQLTISGTSTGFINGGASFSIGSTSNHSLAFYTNNQARMHVDTSGNVGIGTSSPSTALDVSGTATATTFSGSGASLTSIPNAALDNSQITINGTGVSLGGSINVGDITGVTAGNGLTGGGTTGTVTLNVGAGTGVTVNADDIAIGQDVATSASPTFAGLTTTGDINFADDAKAQFGDSNDFTIKHINNTTLDNDTGTIFIRQFADDENIVIQNDDGAGGVTNYIVVNGDTEQTIFSKDTRHGDNVKANFGASNDLQIYHTGSLSLIDDQGTGGLFIRGDAGVYIRSATDENKAIFTSNGSVELYYDNSKKFETTSTGIDVTGEVQADSLDIDGGGDITGTLTLHSNLDMQDGDKILLGTGDDLEIYHDGSNSVIKDTGTGNLYLAASTQLNITNSLTNISLARFIEGGAVELYHNGNKKLETTSSGIAVTGGATFTANVSLGDNDYINLGAGNDLQIFHDTTDSWIQDRGTGNLKLGSNGVGVEIRRKTDSADESMAVFNNNGSVDLYYDNSKKFETTSAGVFVTGNISTADNGKFISGTSADLQMYHDGSNSFVEDTGQGSLVLKTNGAGVYVQSSTSESMASFVKDGAVELYYDNSKKLETTSTGVNVTGTVNANTLSIPDGGNIYVGDGNDLTIYHSGANSHIRDQGTGNLYIEATSSINFRNGTGSETYAVFTENGSVDLYYDNSKKFETTSSGIDVTGTVTADGVSLGDNDKAQFGAGNDLQIYHDGNDSVIEDVGTGELEIRSNGTGVFLQKGTTEYLARFLTDGASELYYNNSKKFETTSAGVTVTGTLTETSSIEYKENVQPLEFNEAIYNVNAVKYDRKDGSQKDEVGVIAEDLYEILPDLVQTKDGKPESVKYTKLTMYLLEALKKQNEEIKMLKEKIN